MSDLTKSGVRPVSKSHQEVLEQAVATLVLEADRAHEAYIRASQYRNRIDNELSVARRALRHHIAAGDQS